MKQAAFFCLLLSATTIVAMELGNPKNNQTKEQSLKEFRRKFDKNQKSAMAWCIIGSVSALLGTKAANMVQQGSVQKSSFIKKSYFFLVFSTLFSIGAMLKHAHSNKKLIQEYE